MVFVFFCLFDECVVEPFGCFACLAVAYGLFDAVLPRVDAELQHGLVHSRGRRGQSVRVPLAEHVDVPDRGVELSGEFGRPLDEFSHVAPLPLFPSGS